MCTTRGVALRWPVGDNLHLFTRWWSVDSSVSLRKMEHKLCQSSPDHIYYYILFLPHWAFWELDTKIITITQHFLYYWKLFWFALNIGASQYKQKFVFFCFVFRLQEKWMGINICPFCLGYNLKLSRLYIPEHIQWINEKEQVRANKHSTGNYFLSLYVKYKVITLTECYHYHEGWFISSRPKADIQIQILLIMCYIIYIILAFFN